jgi:hypothetical protein
VQKIAPVIRCHRGVCDTSAIPDHDPMSMAICGSGTGIEFRSRLTAGILIAGIVVVTSQRSRNSPYTDRRDLS